MRAGRLFAVTRTHDAWRYAPIYTLSEAAHLTGTSAPTVARWLGHGGRRPVLNNEEPGPLVSFLTLAEIVVAKGFRRDKVPLKRVREAHDFAAGQLGIEYPFASMRLKTLGGRIQAQFEEEHPGMSLMVLEQPGAERTLPGIVTSILSSFDYDEDLASRWFPLRREVPIVIDPRYASGMPTIIETGVTIEAVRKRFKGGLSIAFIADDLKMAPETVEAALRYGDAVAA